jgi:hypothetical protein
MKSKTSAPTSRAKVSISRSPDSPTARRPATKNSLPAKKAPVSVAKKTAPRNPRETRTQGDTKLSAREIKRSDRVKPVGRKK